LALLGLPFLIRSEMLFRPPNRGRCKILLAVTASVLLAFLRVRAAEVNKLLPNEGSVSLGGRHLFGNTLNQERMAECVELLSQRSFYTAPRIYTI
jgi:hypothetical protein